MLQYRFIVCDVLQFTLQVMWCIYLMISYSQEVIATGYIIATGYCFNLYNNHITDIVLSLILTKRDLMLLTHLIRTGRG